MNHAPQTPQSLPLVFGDVSRVRYPNGDQVLGGHAFTIAWHLQGLGRPALLVSRVGDDRVGQDALRALHAWELPTLGVQCAFGESTDSVEVQTDGAAPRLSPSSNPPWHRIDRDEALRAAAATGCTLVVHGTACLRSASNRQVLDRLIGQTGAPVLFDAANPACRAEELESSLSRSAWVSVPVGDLPEIGTSLGLSGGPPERLAERLREVYDLSALFVTGDVDGACAITASGERHVVAPAGDLHVIDRIGVEEAFSAIVAFGLLAGWPIEDIARRAQGFVELVAAQPVSAIPAGALYDAVREQWASEGPGAERSGSHGPPIHATTPIPTRVRRTGARRRRKSRRKAPCP